MPMYDFKDNNTNLRFSMQLTILKKEEYLKENPDIRQIIGAPSTIRGSGGLKNDEGWKENLARIAEAHSTSAFAEKIGGRKTKELKTKEVLKKHGLI